MRLMNIELIMPTEDDNTEPEYPVQPHILKTDDPRFIGNGWLWGAHREWMCGNCNKVHGHVGWCNNDFKILEIIISTQVIGGEVGFNLRSRGESAIKLYSLEPKKSDCVLTMFTNPIDAALAAAIAEQVIDWENLDPPTENAPWLEKWTELCDAWVDVGLIPVFDLDGREVLVMSPEQRPPPRSMMS